MRGDRYRRALRAVAALAMWPAMTWVGVGCDGEPADRSVIVRVDLERAQRWSASGDLVDRGGLCPAGTRHVLDAIDADTGRRLATREEVELLADAIAGPGEVPVVWTVEHTCTDGSGSFVTRENWDADEWSVESGTGAYRRLEGAGHVWFTTADYTQIAPRLLVIEATVTT
jgi:hypothetical protein